MKKKIFSIIGLLLCFVVCFSSISCNKKPKVSESKHVRIESDSETYLVKNGSAVYKILVDTTDKTKYMVSAVKELKNFFAETTGVELPIVDNANYVSGDKYISIGKTPLSKDLEREVTYKKYGEDGYRIITKDENVILLGGGKKGNLFAVYDFLEVNLGCKVYAADEIKITKTSDLKLKNLDIIEIPDFALRSAGYYKISTDETLRNRLKLDFYNDGWIYWTHSHFLIMPKATYFVDHPDWYSADGNQLCLTNEEMIEEFIKNVTKLMEEHPDDTHIMLGQQDHNSFCGCSKCAKEVGKYFESGTMMRFVNKVADGVKDYIAASDNPTRQMTVATYAYQKTVPAPVKYNEKYKIYDPIDASVVPRDNVAIMYAPLAGCYSHNLLDENCNSLSATALRGWSSIFKKNLFVRMYNAQYAYYYMPYNNWSAFQDNFRALKNINCGFAFDASANETMNANLGELRGYVSSQLMWNTERDMQSIIEEFAYQYYREAGVKIIEYIKLNRLYWRDLETKIDIHLYPTASKGGEYYKAEIWTNPLLLQMERLFDEAEQLIEKYKITDKNLYTSLKFRIDRERLTPIFLQLELHPDKYMTDEKIEKINFFEKICFQAGIDRYCEQTIHTGDKTIVTLVSKWRSTIL